MQGYNGSVQVLSFDHDISIKRLYQYNNQEEEVEVEGEEENISSRRKIIIEIFFVSRVSNFWDKRFRKLFIREKTLKSIPIYNTITNFQNKNKEKKSSLIKSSNPFIVGPSESESEFF